MSTAGLSILVSLEQLKDELESLNERIRTEPITLAEAKEIYSRVRELEGWMKGIRELLEVK